MVIPGRVLLGGGYRIPSALAYRAYCSHLASRAAVRVLNVHYRLAPEAPFPAAIEDVLSAYSGCWRRAHWGRAWCSPVTRQGAVSPLPHSLPCAIGVSPSPRKGVSFALARSHQLGGNLRDSSRGGHDVLTRVCERPPGCIGRARRPEASNGAPVFADLSGLPPLLILVGDAEVLLDDAHKLAETTRVADVAAELFVYPEMPHVWMLNYPAFPEAALAFDQVAAFVARDALTREKWSGQHAF
jgi:epsilon-lactone hydrolase